MKVKRKKWGFLIICSVLGERKGSREDAMEWYAPWNIRAMPLWMRRTLLALVVLCVPFAQGMCGGMDFPGEDGILRLWSPFPGGRSCG